MQEFERSSALGPLKIAHRGEHRIHLENTLEAFRAAYEAGCDMVEFDVQLTKDGVPVIFHDDDLLRIAERPDLIQDLKWAELQSMRLPAAKRRGPVRGKAGALAEYPLPSLEEFLAEFSGKPFYLELKVPKSKVQDKAYIQSLGEKVAKMVSKSKPHPLTFLASFHEGILLHIAEKKLYPVLTGIFEDYTRFMEVQSGKDKKTAAAIRYYSVSWTLFLRFMKGRGRVPTVPGPDKFMVWNISGERDFRFAISHYVYAIVTDEVESLLRL